VFGLTPIKPVFSGWVIIALTVPPMRLNVMPVSPPHPQPMGSPTAILPVGFFCAEGT
jgi:hypothetical protein